MKKVILAIAVILTASAAGCSQTVIKQCLDSIVTEMYKFVFSYDNEEKNILEIRYRWNEETNNWKEEVKSEYTYDINGNEIGFIGYNWYSVTNDWEISFKSEHTYDNNGNQTMHIMYDWDSAIKDWEKITEKRKYENTYDSNNNLTMTVLYRWDYKKKKFCKTETETKYTYNNEGYTAIYICHEWSHPFKIESTWDINGNLIKKNFYGEVGIVKDEYTYDDNGNQILAIVYKWDEKTKNRIWYEKTEYIFNPFKTDLIKPAGRYVGTNMLKEEIKYKWSGTEWEQEDVTTYYWSPKEISTENKK